MAKEANNQLALTKVNGSTPPIPTTEKVNDEDLSDSMDSPIIADWTRRAKPKNANTSTISLDDSAMDAATVNNDSDSDNKLTYMDTSSKMSSKDNPCLNTEYKADSIQLKVSNYCHMFQYLSSCYDII